MKAMAIKEAGGPDKLKLVELQESQPSSNQVLIEQYYAAVNYGDITRRKRGLFQLNDQGYFVPGFEGSGKIISIGNNVTEFVKGDYVAYLSESSGGYGQRVCIDQNNVFKIPPNILPEVAAGLTCVGATAWHLINSSKIKKDDWVLIHGAAGGVGLMLVQLAIINGVRLIAIVGTEEKKEFLKKFGDFEIIVDAGEKTINKIMNVTNNYGVDYIFDCVGQSVIDLNLDCIHPGGSIFYYGSTSGHPCFPGANILMNSIKIQGFVVFKILQNKEKWDEGMASLYSGIEAKKLFLPISKILPMSQAADAHRLLEERKVIGKILLDMKR